MFRIRLGWLATATTTALLGLMLFGSSLAFANGPGWVISGQASLPPAVSPGGVAGYTFTITNGGTSNISQLYLTANSPEVYFTSSRPCLVLQNNPNLYCSLGALNTTDFVTFTVAFRTPTSGSTFNPMLQFNTTGVATTDPHKSHGDTKDVGLTTALNGNGDFAGAFTLDQTILSTNGTLGRNNVQDTSVTPPDVHIPVTVDDSGSVTFDCSSSTSCSNAFGVWTNLHVNGGATYSGSAFQVTLMLYGKSVPSGVATSDIKVLHVLDGGTVETLTQTGNACPADPSTTTADCIASVSKQGNNYQIVLWLIQNGGLRGAY